MFPLFSMSREALVTFGSDRSTARGSACPPDGCQALPGALGDQPQMGDGHAVSEQACQG